MLGKKGMIEFMGIFTAILTALGAGSCSKPEQEKALLAAELSSDEICAVYYGCNHMERDRAFRFAIEEKEDAVQFSALCSSQDELVELEEISIPEEKMTELQHLMEQWQTANFLCNYEQQKNLPEMQDQTTFTFSVKWADGTELSADSAGEYAGDLEKFFRELTDSCKKSCLPDGKQPAE